MSEMNNADRCGELLRDAFVAHEHLAPDAEVVYAGAKARARAYRRRRRAAQGAGGAVLGAGVVAAGINLPGLLPQSNGRAGLTISAAAGGPSQAVPSSLSPAQQQVAWDAYFAAGYGYDDAVQLGKLWNMTADPGTIKAEAGRRLLAGQTLPIQPHPNASVPASSVDPAETADINAFFDAGYTYNDAVQLAQLWSTADPYHAKIDAGRKLLAGVPLPIAPSAPSSAASQPSASATASVSAADQTDIDAFYSAGYTYADAVKLAQLWHSTDPYGAKITAGRQLLAGQTLPIAP